MKKHIILSAAILSGILFSCGSETKKTDETSAEKCLYSVVNENSTLEWTAFKFTERKGVTGTFREINIDGLAFSFFPFIYSLNI
jgi:hypothetical protein